MPRPSPKTETRCCRSARWRQDPLLHFSSATTTSFARGIKSSNPPPSSGKSRANLIPRSGRRIFHRSPGERKIAHSANILSSEDRPTFAMNDYLPCGNLKINGSLVGSMTKRPLSRANPDGFPRLAVDLGSSSDARLRTPFHRRGVFALAVPGNITPMPIF